MSAGEHLSAVQQRIAQLQRELIAPGPRVDAGLFRARLDEALSSTPVASADEAPSTASALAPTSITLGQYLGSPQLGALARATLAAPATAAAPVSGPAFHGIALTDPIHVEAGSAYGQRLHPIHGTVTMHHGQDYGAPTGTPIHAAAAGTVVWAGERGGYGNLVEIDHGNGVTTRYAHASRLDVAVGDRVDAGQVVAAVGSTGLSTGPHLHFEVRHDGESVDPSSWLPGGQHEHHGEGE